MKYLTNKQYIGWLRYQSYAIQYFEPFVAAPFKVLDGTYQPLKQHHDLDKKENIATFSELSRINRKKPNKRKLLKDIDYFYDFDNPINFRRQFLPYDFYLREGQNWTPQEINIFKPKQIKNKWDESIMWNSSNLSNGVLRVGFDND